MITNAEVQRQLKAIKSENRFWGRGELRELEHILVPGETIMYCIGGRYEGGFATLCITDMRIVLVDKKPLYLTVEDLRYDMVSEVDFNKRLIDSTLVVCTVNKQLRFTSTKSKMIRRATNYIQSRVMEFRQQHMMNEGEVPFSNMIQQNNTNNTSGVKSLQHRVINPYTRVSLITRRRASRFYSN